MNNYNMNKMQSLQNYWATKSGDETFFSAIYIPVYNLIPKDDRLQYTDEKEHFPFARSQRCIKISRGRWHSNLHSDKPTEWHLNKIKKMRKSATCWCTNVVDVVSLLLIFV